MKKNIIWLALFSSVVSAQYVVIIDSNKNYTLDSVKTVEYTDWTVMNIVDCVNDINPENVYYGIEKNQLTTCNQEEKREKITKIISNNVTINTVTEEEFRTVETLENQMIIGNHLESSCKDIQNFDNTITTGTNNIRLSNNSVLNVYCDMNVDGGGWTLVRRIVNNGSGWNGFTDNLVGLQSTGTYKADPLHSSTFGIQFNNFNYNEVLLSTGNKQKWLITDKSSIYNTWNNDCNINNAIVYKSSLNINGPAKNVAWCKRVQNPEDPWISIENHSSYGISGSTDSNTHSMLYGENSPVWLYYLNNYNGSNIYIR